MKYSTLLAEVLKCHLTNPTLTAIIATRPLELMVGYTLEHICMHCIKCTQQLFRTYCSQYSECAGYTALLALMYRRCEDECLAQEKIKNMFFSQIPGLSHFWGKTQLHNIIPIDHESPDGDI